jgi:predicted CxxxxCH...CXXCH cytochrome family protein
MSLGFAGASYQPTTKTCSSVACHLAQTSVAWGGAPDANYDACKACHGL